MALPDIDTALAWRGRTVRDPDGEKVGTLGAVYLDRETDRPAWAGVKTGLFGSHESLVPLEQTEEDGDDLRVPYPRDRVKDAPQVDPDVALAEEEERRLYAHYGAEYAPVDADGDAGDGYAGARDASAEATMIRSEEEVVAAQGPMRAAERVRLKKVLVDDEVTRTVPVRREVVQLEHEPPPPGDVESVEDLGERPDDRG